MIGNPNKRVNMFRIFHNIEFREQIRFIWSTWRGDIILVGGVGMCLFLAFMAGRISVRYFETERQPLTINPLRLPETTISDDKISMAIADATQQPFSQKNEEPPIFVASKNGTKYYLPECSGAKRIKEYNKIYFSSREEAEKAGYEPAVSCPALLQKDQK